MNPGNVKNAGFTLIEVLLAGVIMVMVISSVSLIYRGAALSSQKAERTAAFSAAIPYLLETIRQDIRQIAQSETAINGSGQWLKVNYWWNSELLQKRAAPPTYDPELGTKIVYPERYKLWQVELTVEISGYQKQFKFREVSW